MMIKFIIKCMLSLLLCITACMTSNAQQVRIRCFFNGFYTDPDSMTPIVDPTNNPLLFDTVKVELVEPVFGTISYSVDAIDSTNGWLNFTVPSSLLNTDQYITIKQRSCIKTWSDTIVKIDTLTTFDFTTSATQAFGNNEFSNPSGIASVYVGDFNNDGKIDSLDFYIYNADVANFAGGPYLIDDINGDQSVDIFDYPILEISLLDSIKERKPTFATVSVPEIKKGFLKLYPVPAKDQLIIMCNDRIVSCSVYNLEGQLIFTNGSGLPKMEITTSGFPAGMYIARIITDSGIINKSFLVQH